MIRRASLAAFAVLAGLALGGLTGTAQTVDTSAAATESKTPRNVDIEADTMEILDEQKKAIFKGNVKAKRGDVTLNADLLTVTYEEQVDPKNKDEKKTEVTLLDAEGSVVIVTAKQTVTGKTAHMDVKSNKLWVKGGAKVVQGKTVMNGEQLFVDLKTNKSEMTGGRVKGSFVPGQ